MKKVQLKESLYSTINFLKRPRVTIPTLIILLVFASFYWFQLRPRIIRKNCNESAIKAAQKENGGETYYTKDYNHYYSVCVRKRQL